MIHHGDCVGVMASMPEASVDAIVCDPPYGLEFMGKEWDRLWRTDQGGPSRRDGRLQGQVRRLGNGAPSPRYEGGVAAQAWHQRWAEAAYRVAKPSAYLLAFGGTRTVHRLTCALEDAGWIIRDMLCWVYASGFPKSKASLKPAWEPIVMARKPGPLRELAIDACRIPFESPGDRAAAAAAAVGFGGSMERGTVAGQVSFPTQYDPQTKRDYIAGLAESKGRWPANVILTDGIFDGGVDGVVGGGTTTRGGETVGDFEARSGFGGGRVTVDYGDTGTYSRFFLIPKADRADREPVLGGLPLSNDPFAGAAHSKWCEACGKQAVNVPGAACSCAEPQWTTRAQRKRANHHPTVKPTELMRHLVRLVTPVGGTVLDPFAGSGSTLLAAEREGFAWIGIEREAEYVAIAEARLNGTQRGLGLAG